MDTFSKLQPVCAMAISLICIMSVSLKSSVSTMTSTLDESSFITAIQFLTPFAQTRVSILFSFDIEADICAIFSLAAFFASSLSSVLSTTA